MLDEQWTRLTKSDLSFKDENQCSCTSWQLKSTLNAAERSTEEAGAAGNSPILLP